MKKLHLFLMLAAMVLMASCKSDSDKISDDGILGKEGTKIAKSLDEAETSYREAIEYRKTHSRDTREELDKSSVLDFKAEEAKDALEKLVNELSERLIGRELPVEVDNDIPMKIVEPMKVTKIKCNDGSVKLFLSGAVEMLRDAKVGKWRKDYFEDIRVAWVFVDGDGQFFKHVNSLGEVRFEVLDQSWMLKDFDEKVNAGDRVKVNLDVYLSAQKLARKKIRLVQVSTLDRERLDDKDSNDESQE